MSITKKSKNLLVKILINAINSAKTVDMDNDDLNRDKFTMENTADELYSDKGDFKLSDNSDDSYMTHSILSDTYNHASDAFSSDKLQWTKDIQIYIRSMKSLTANPLFKPFLTKQLQDNATLKKDTFKADIKQSFIDYDTSMIVLHMKKILKVVKHWKIK